MKKIIYFFALFPLSVCFGQNVKMEIVDYHKVNQGKIYATYQFAQSSYSRSRPTAVFITNKKTLFDLSEKIPKWYGMKQEFTDIWILGIENVDIKNITESDKNIIDLFLKSIIKYRNDNDLPHYSLERLQEDKILIAQPEDFCNYIKCGK